MNLHRPAPDEHEAKGRDLLTLGIAAPLVALAIAMLILPGMLPRDDGSAPRPATPVQTEALPYALHLPAPPASLWASLFGTAAIRPAAA